MKTGKTFIFKISALILSSMLLLACATDQSMTPPSKTVGLEFKLPPNNKMPEISKGKTTVDVNAGDTIKFGIDPGSGPVLLVIQNKDTPFANGAFAIRILPGNNPKNNEVKIAEGKMGIYKYIIIDTAGNRSKPLARPPLDPFIDVKN